MPEVCKKRRGELTVVIYNIKPLIFCRIRELREKTRADGISPAVDIAADGSDRIAEKGREQQRTYLTLFNQITQGIPPAVERHGTLVQQGEPVAFQLQIAADFTVIVQHMAFLGL